MNPAEFQMKRGKMTVDGLRLTAYGGRPTADAGTLYPGTLFRERCTLARRTPELRSGNERWARQNH
ncbi:MAG: hypothetical protein IT261_07920 [Saprospiraceae bacterium]|nr:hypothetical protein [Saprospiraceae bacterium]